MTAPSSIPQSILNDTSFLKSNVGQTAGKFVHQNISSSSEHVYHNSLLVGKSAGTRATLQDGSIWPAQVQLKTCVTSSAGQPKHTVASHQQYDGNGGNGITMATGQQRVSSTCATAWSTIPTVAFHIPQPIGDVIGLSPVLMNGNTDTSVVHLNQNLYLQRPPPLVQVWMFKCFLYL